MKRFILLTLSLWLLAAGGGVAGADPVQDWAPVIYVKETNTSPTAKENVFTRVNYDGDWRTNNNWQDLPYHPPEAVAYYSLVESETHYYIGYYFYYPRYLGPAAKEHYLAGLMAVVRKEGGGTGQLDGVATYSRKQWDWRPGQRVGYLDGRFMVTVSDNDRELNIVGSGRKPPAYPKLPPLLTGQETLAAGKRQNEAWIHAGYRLVPLDELWERRQDVGSGRTYGRWGYFDSAAFAAGAAALPWVWEYRKANWLAQPAELIGLLQGIKGVTAQYVYNPYRDAVTAK